jgi:hypothetical protein
MKERHHIAILVILSIENSNPVHLSSFYLLCRDNLESKFLPLANQECGEEPTDWASSSSTSQQAHYGGSRQVSKQATDM